MRRILIVLPIVFAVACGTTPTTPVTGALAVSSVSPSTLSTTGGATVTILGAGFAADTTVTIGGIAVTVSRNVDGPQTSTSIAVTAPAHAAGPSSVVVSSGGKSVSTSVTFVAPAGLNAVPVISSLRISGPGNKPPSPFVDLANSVTLSATVTDVETSPAALTYVWTVGAGTTSGTGASVTWNLPATLAATPAATTVTLTVTETFTESGVQHRHAVSSSILADAHDSSTEILNKGFRFLDLFSQSAVSPAQVLSDFHQSCDGYFQELEDTESNRLDYVYLSYAIVRLPPVEFKFGQSCPNPKAVPPGDACAVFHTDWFVRALRDVPKDGVLRGELVTSRGRDFVANVFRDGQWKLCSSFWSPDEPTSLVVSPSGATRRIPTPQGIAPGRVRRE